MTSLSEPESPQPMGDGRKAGKDLEDRRDDCHQGRLALAPPSQEPANDPLPPSDPPAARERVAEEEAQKFLESIEQVLQEGEPEPSPALELEEVQLVHVGGYDLASALQGPDSPPIETADPPSDLPTASSQASLDPALPSGVAERAADDPIRMDHGHGEVHGEVHDEMADSSDDNDAMEGDVDDDEEEAQAEEQLRALFEYFSSRSFVQPWSIGTDFSTNVSSDILEYFEQQWPTYAHQQPLTVLGLLFGILFLSRKRLNSDLLSGSRIVNLALQTYAEDPDGGLVQSLALALRCWIDRGHLDLSALAVHLPRMQGHLAQLREDMAGYAVEPPEFAFLHPHVIAAILPGEEDRRRARQRLPTPSASVKASPSIPTLSFKPAFAIPGLTERMRRYERMSKLAPPDEDEVQLVKRVQPVGGPVDSDDIIAIQTLNVPQDATSKLTSAAKPSTGLRKRFSLAAPSAATPIAPWASGAVPTELPPPTPTPAPAPAPTPRTTSRTGKLPFHTPSITPRGFQKPAKAKMLNLVEATKLDITTRRAIAAANPVKVDPTTVRAQRKGALAAAKSLSAPAPLPSFRKRSQSHQPHGGGVEDEDLASAWPEKRRRSTSTMSGSEEQQGAPTSALPSYARSGSAIGASGGKGALGVGDQATPSRYAIPKRAAADDPPYAQRPPATPGYGGSAASPGLGVHPSRMALLADGGAAEAEGPSRSRVAGQAWSTRRQVEAEDWDVPRRSSRSPGRGLRRSRIEEEREEEDPIFDYVQPVEEEHAFLSAHVRSPPPAAGRYSGLRKKQAPSPELPAYARAAVSSPAASPITSSTTPLPAYAMRWGTLDTPAPAVTSQPPTPVLPAYALASAKPRDQPPAPAACVPYVALLPDNKGRAGASKRGSADSSLSATPASTPSTSSTPPYAASRPITPTQTDAQVEFQIQEIFSIGALLSAEDKAVISAFLRGQYVATPRQVREIKLSERFVTLPASGSSFSSGGDASAVVRKKESFWMILDYGEAQWRKVKRSSVLPAERRPSLAG